MSFHAGQLNKLIQVAAQRVDFDIQGYRSFETENQANLTRSLKGANLFFTSSVLGMEAVSHVIEDQALAIGGKFRFYSAFQKFSRVKPQTVRYQQLASLGNPIYIFGQPDAKLLVLPNLHAVELQPCAGPDLTHNWFVILHNPNFVSMALVCREIPPATNRPRGAPDKLLYRNFEGFWTYDQTVISEVVAVLDDFIRQAGAAAHPIR